LVTTKLLKEDGNVDPRSVPIHATVITNEPSDPIPALRSPTEAVVDARLLMEPLLEIDSPEVKFEIEAVIDDKLVVVAETTIRFCTVSETAVMIPIEAEVAAIPPGITNAAVDPLVAAKELLIINEPAEFAKDIANIDEVPLISETN
jgi:hypothetical protein